MATLKESELLRTTASDLLISDLIRIVDGGQSRNITVQEFVTAFVALAPGIISNENPANFLELPDTPASFDSQGTDFLIVNAAENAVEFLTDPGFLTDIQSQSIVSLLDVFSAMNPNANELLTYDGVNNRWDSAPNSANTFIGSADTPSTFSGEGGQGLRVNVAEDALEFTALVDTISDLSDTPADLTGAAGAVLTVNVAETATEWLLPIVTPPVVVLDNPLLVDGFDVVANTVSANFESIGPTGSGATNIWSALDAVPATTTHIEVRFVASVEHGGFGGVRLRGYWRTPLSVDPMAAYVPVCDTGTTLPGVTLGQIARDTSTTTIFLDGDSRFEIGYIDSGFGGLNNVDIYLVGYYASS